MRKWRLSSLRCVFLPWETEQDSKSSALILNIEIICCLNNFSSYGMVSFTRLGVCVLFLVIPESFLNK